MNLDFLLSEEELDLESIKKLDLEAIKNEIQKQAIWKIKLSKGKKNEAKRFHKK